MRCDTRTGAWTLLALTAAVLAAAFAAQHIAGLTPCRLCVWQRYPWALAGLATGATLLLPPGWRRPSLGVAALTLTAGAVLAGFHLGVEQDWWPGLPGCSAPEIDPSMSAADLKAMLESRRNVVPCGDPAGVVLGVSMAGQNMLASLAGAAFGWIVTARARA